MKTILIPKLLIQDLEEAISIDNRKLNRGLKVDVAAYFVSLLISISTCYRQIDNVGNSIRLSSKRLRQINYRYSEYLQFLISYGFIIKIKNYSTDNKTCNSYKIGEPYIDMELITYVITNKFLLKRFDKNGFTESQNDKMNIVLELRPHLISGFNNSLVIDSKSAKQEILLYLEDDYNKYRSASQMLLEWENRAWNYSIKPNSDNRLHSTLTRTNKILRKHITYDGVPLGEVDLKTSQPYFLMAILNGILKGDKDYLKDLGVLKVVGEEVLCNLLNLDIDVENVSLFTHMILNRDLYEELTSIIPIDYENNKAFRMVWPDGQYGVPKIRKLYDSERDLMKEIVLEVLNGSVKSRKTEVVAFKKLFPCVDKLLNCLDQGGVKVFNLLSYVEAYCLLDIVAEYITAEYEEIPLLSIHDSLVTIENYLPIIKREMEYVLENITGYKPNLKVELWGEGCSSLQEKLLNLP